MGLNDNLRRAVKTHFLQQMPDSLRALRRNALWDLHYGPSGVDEDYPGYTTALKELGTWAQDNIAECWINWSGEAVLEEPPEALRYFSRQDVMRVVFTELISDGGMSA